MLRWVAFLLVLGGAWSGAGWWRVLMIAAAAIILANALLWTVVLIFGALAVWAPAWGQKYKPRA